MPVLANTHRTEMSEESALLALVQAETMRTRDVTAAAPSAP